MVSRPFVAASSLLALISASPSFAQGNAAQPAQDTNAGGKPVAQNQQEPAIVVTAQLREQRQIDVPNTREACDHQRQISQRFAGPELEQLSVSHDVLQ